MKNYTVFSVSDKSAKAYHTLESLYEIERSGVNLNQYFADIVSSAAQGKVYAIPFLECKKILNAALQADLPDVKSRNDFINDYMNKKRFQASNEVSNFIINALQAPDDESDTNSDTEKKN